MDPNNINLKILFNKIQCYLQVILPYRPERIKYIIMLCVGLITDNRRLYIVIHVIIMKFSMIMIHD